jgi:DNA-binding transcriptional LysR family regulator
MVFIGASMDWDDLRVFSTLARKGYLSAPAQRLDVSHPTIARRVKGCLGTRLLDWLPDRFVLTSAGEELLADAEAMEAAAAPFHLKGAKVIREGHSH